ncbi:MAG: M61 family peptidase [Verrucomicrobia bacterium]|nr:M61 family peptidase [Verrucomicrobiota bacterium]
MGFQINKSALPALTSNPPKAIRDGMRGISLVLFFSLIIPATRLAAQTPAPSSVPSQAISLQVDATEVARKLLHSHLTIPVTPGPLTLYYPKWIPGEHAPTGPIDSVVGMKFSVNGQPLPWRRDLVDLYAVHCEIPAGASLLEIGLDFAMPVEPAAFSSEAAASAKLAMINWYELLLYPAGVNPNDLTFQTELRLPQHWRFGTALPLLENGDPIRFRPVSLTTLADSPLVAGLYYRHVQLATTAPTNEMDIVADSSAALDLPDEKITQYQHLVTEAGALFSATHYEHYHFLVALSDQTFHDGIEHHESSLNAIREDAFTEKDQLDAASDLLPHEFVHSWNGKYRRPADLATPDFQKPMLDDLLWVYEGLTEYLGTFVLTARSGLRSPELSRDFLAFCAADLDTKSGRQWRSLQDTADNASHLYAASEQWEDRRRAVDFYPEGVLLWLEADTIIRQQTNGQRSIDNFCHAFHGGQSGPPMLKTYTFDDVIETLNSVAPYDWRRFWLTRLNSISQHAPLNGIEAAGWKLFYSDKRNLPLDVAAKERKHCNERYSIGLLFDEDGTIVDVVANSAADVAKLAPGMKIVAVNSRAFSVERLREAIKGTAHSESAPIELILTNSDYYETVHLDYHGGLRYPHLERTEAQTDLLGSIIAPHAK